MKKLFGSLIALMCVVACLLTLPIEADAATSGYYTYSVSNGEATITYVNTSISGAITIPSTLGGCPVTSLGSSALYNCDSLTSITIPDSVTSIGGSAFAGCDGLTGIWVDEGNPYYCSDDRGVLFNKNQTTLIRAPGALTGNYMIPDSVTSIGGSAFAGCDGLISITIPDSVTSIGDHAFSGCSSLTAVTIGNSVTSIGDAAFSGCDSLTSINIPDSVTSIGKEAIAYCDSLTGIWVDGNNQHYSNDARGVLFNKDKTILIQASGAFSGSYIIPDSVTDIGNYAFTECSGLINITIGSSVNNFGLAAFRNCRGLTSVTIEQGVTSIGYSAFQYCTSLTSVTVPDSVTTIGDYAFYNCTSLTSVTIPDSVTSIGDYAFYNCDRLTSVTIPDSVTSIGADAFNYCTSLTSVTIGNSVTSIGGSAFAGCDSLTNVTIPDSVTTIGDYAFYNCDRLTSVTIGDSVTSIGRYAFYNCTSLTSVTIPDSVTSIGADAFNYCTSLTLVIYCGTEEQWNAIFIGSSNTSLTNAKRSYHNWQDATCTEPKACTICGETTGEANGHNWQNATCTTPKTCTVCGSSDGEALGHNYFLDIVNPTCTQQGYTKFMCFDCGHSYNAHYVAALGHAYIRIDDSCTAPRICEDCGAKDYSEVSDHSYVTEILEMPTFTTTGQQQKICSACGDTVIETLDMLAGEVSGWNVTLQDDLQVNFHLNISEAIENTARVRIVVGEEGYTFRVSGLEKTEDGLYIASVNIAAAQMTDFIFVTVINGSDLAETASYTVRGYADTILADEDYSQYHQLVREMLNYGAAAQVYFDYEKDNLANDGITDTGSAEIPDSVDSELSVAGNAEGVTFYGASLIFHNRIAVRYYFQFKGDINDCSFTVNDTTYSRIIKTISKGVVFIISPLFKRLYCRSSYLRYNQYKHCGFVSILLQLDWFEVTQTTVTCLNW